MFAYRRMSLRLLAHNKRCHRRSRPATRQTGEWRVHLISGPAVSAAGCHCRLHTELVARQRISVYYLAMADIAHR